MNINTILNALFFFYISLIGFFGNVCSNRQNQSKNHANLNEIVTHRGIKLAVSTYYPLKEDNNKILIVMHGARKFDRSFYEPLALKYASAGFTVITFDKRGTGESTGKYTEINCKNAAALFDTLAVDAIAVMNYVHSKIKNKTLGILSTSQSGWIFPKVVNQSKDKVRFTIVISGPTTSLGMEQYFSKLTGDEKPGKEYTEVSDLDHIYEKVRVNTKEICFDPIPEIEKINIPVLWLYGAKDQSVPTRICIEQIKWLQQKKQNLYYFKLYENANHSLKNIGTGLQENHIADILLWLDKLNL